MESQGNLLQVPQVGIGNRGDRLGQFFPTSICQPAQLSPHISDVLDIEIKWVACVHFL